MHLLKSLLIAFSVYSRIPVPQFAWKEEDIKYMLCFFPWIGAVIGSCIYLWHMLCIHWSIGNFCRTAVLGAIPLLITGGIHADGFLDVMDAFHSYQPRERKLQILSDAHIGAFSVIMSAMYGLLYLAAFSEIADGRMLKTVCGGFFLSRCLCGISVLTFPLAKQEGMLFGVVKNSSKNIVKPVLYLQAMACIGYMIFCLQAAGALVAAAVLLSVVYYYYRARKEFGGITGDTSGYFVLLCEICILITAAVLQIAGVGN